MEERHMPLRVEPIRAFNDNYIWCIHNGAEAVVVDPGSAKDTLNYLEDNALKLIAILVTHHHPDHIGGLKQLKQRFECDIYGFEHAKYQPIDVRLADTQKISLLGTHFQVIHVPGHTLDHIAFYSQNDGEHAEPWLFSGDTLFSGGCGRLFEGSAEQMHTSLSKLGALPDTCQVYCAHEYTLSNLAFACAFNPNNEDLQTYLDACRVLRSNDLPTLPSTVGNELKINPFLRIDDPDIINALALTDQLPVNDQSNAVMTFAHLRKAKDNF
jgi:hydroxyacylglutathione hydrolase